MADTEVGSESRSSVGGMRRRRMISVFVVLGLVALVALIATLVFGDDGDDVADQDGLRISAGRGDRQAGGAGGDVRRGGALDDHGRVGDPLRSRGQDQSEQPCASVEGPSDGHLALLLRYRETWKKACCC